MLPIFSKIKISSDHSYTQCKVLSPQLWHQKFSIFVSFSSIFFSDSKCILEIEFWSQKKPPWSIWSWPKKKIINSGRVVNHLDSYTLFLVIPPVSTWGQHISRKIICQFGTLQYSTFWNTNIKTNKYHKKFCTQFNNFRAAVFSQYFSLIFFLFHQLN